MRTMLRAAEHHVWASGPECFFCWGATRALCVIFIIFFSQNILLILWVFCLVQPFTLALSAPHLCDLPPTTTTTTAHFVLSIH